MAAAAISLLQGQHAGLRALRSKDKTWILRVVPYTKLCPILLPALRPKGGRARTQQAPTPTLQSSLFSTLGFTWDQHAHEALCIHTLKCVRCKRLQVDCNLVLE